MSNKELKIGDNKIIKHLAEISNGLMLSIGTVVVSNPSVTSV